MLAHALSAPVRVNDAPFSEILRARMAIEPALVWGAALRGTEAHFREMDATIERLGAAGADAQAVYREAREFHRIIARGVEPGARGVGRRSASSRAARAPGWPKPRATDPSAGPRRTNG